MSFRTATLYFYLLVASSLHELIGVDFTSSYNHYHGLPIKKFKICGERCSGTNFTEKLISLNFSDLQSARDEYGHKHYMRWFGINNSSDLEKTLDCPIDFSDAEDCLFIVVVRDPYDWLRSFYLKQHDVDGSVMLEKTFSHFIRAQWKNCNKIYHVVDNYNPWTKRPFKNVLELRGAKMLNYLNLSSLVDNYLLVRYEDVRDHPKEFVNFVAKFFHVEKSKQFIPIEKYVSPFCEELDKKFEKKKQFRIKSMDLRYINQKVDWKIEEQAGFIKKNKRGVNIKL